MLEDPKIEIPWPWLAGAIASIITASIAGLRWLFKWLKEGQETNQKLIVDVLKQELDRGHSHAKDITDKFDKALERRDAIAEQTASAMRELTARIEARRQADERKDR